MNLQIGEPVVRDDALDNTEGTQVVGKVDNPLSDGRPVGITKLQQSSILPRRDLESSSSGRHK